MTLRPLLLAVALAFPIAVLAVENPAAVKAIEEYLDFTEYGSSLIWPEQIPADDWKNVFVVDARDAAQYAKAHIPGAVNIEWRQAVARRGEPLAIPALPLSVHQRFMETRGDLLLTPCALLADSRGGWREPPGT